MSKAGLAAEKRQVREFVRLARQHRSAAEQRQAGVGFATQLRGLVQAQQARSLSCFLPVRGEPDTREFLEWAATHEIDVLLPSPQSDGALHWVRASSTELRTELSAGLKAGLFGIPEPRGARLPPAAVSEVDLMLLPAAAIDREGNRLGWGRGYFDRALAEATQRPPAFAVVYENEVLERLPAEGHDIPVQGVVTEERFRRFTD